MRPSHDHFVILGQATAQRFCHPQAATRPIAYVILGQAQPDPGIQILAA